MLRYRDLAIFVPTDDRRQTKLIALSLAHACGVIIMERGADTCSLRHTGIIIPCSLYYIATGMTENLIKSE